MDSVEVRKEYFDWLCSLVDAGPKWHLLWYKLHSMAFVWLFPRDENRAEDGKYLRYLYSLERAEDGLSDEEIEEYLAGPCTVLEFLVGLAKRIEDDIMYDANEDNRTYIWFWEMIENLGLDKYDDDHYSDIEIDDIVNRFMSRKYKKGGPGNIFKSGPGWKKMAQNMEIWEQVHAWSSEKR